MKSGDDGQKTFVRSQRMRAYQRVRAGSQPPLADASPLIAWDFQ
jgi:hypothetical protein